MEILPPLQVAKPFHTNFLTQLVGEHTLLTAPDVDVSEVAIDAYPLTFRSDLSDVTLATTGRIDVCRPPPRQHRRDSPHDG
jgi:hypothetical protein